MHQKTFHWIRCALFVSTIIVLPATSTVAQMGAGGYGGMGIAGTSIQGPIAGLPSWGVLAVRNSIRVGGVTISEVRGLAVVLSANPLVLVTGKELLQVGEEYPDEIQGAVSSVVCSYYTPVFDGGMGGDGGGMGPGMGGMGGGMGGGGLGGVRSDFVLEPQPLIVRDAESNLLFIFATAKVDHNHFSSARLAKNPNPTDDWLKSAWLEGEHPEILQENANASTIVTIAPDGSVALIVDGKIYGRDAIMKEYLQVYNSQNQAAAVAPVDPLSTNRSLAARPGTPSFPDRNASEGTRAAFPRAALPNEWLAPPSGQSLLPSTYQAQRLETPNPRSDRIINAVVEVKKADDEAQAAKARSQLRELLEIEFDAQRTQKATELESLRQRIQQLEKAEEELRAQRDQTIEQRLQRLLGKPAR